MDGLQKGAVHQWEAAVSVPFADVLFDNFTSPESHAQSRGSFCSDNKGSWSWVHCTAMPADTASYSAPGQSFLTNSPAQSECGLRSAFQPTTHHFGGFVIPGDSQHLAFGGTGVHKQIHDLIDGVLIVRVKPEQQFDLQRLIK